MVGTKLNMEAKLGEKKKIKNYNFFFFKYEPYMDNMDVVSTSQSRYFHKYIDF